MLQGRRNDDFVLASSRPEQQPPRGILKKPSSSRTSPASSTPSSPTHPFPSDSPTSDLFALAGYRPQQWSVVGIAKAHHSPSSTAGRKDVCLIVTLLYVPTETLYAWPFNLSSPDAKGVCYETHSAAKEGEAARIPPEGTMSISLRVLVAVIRNWMTIRQERSALARHRGSSGSSASLPGSPGSSVDDVVDNDEVIDEIIDTLRLHQLTPFERSIYLLRQHLPQESITAKTERQTSRSGSVPSPGAQSDSSSRRSDAEWDEHARRLNGSTSSISTLATSTQTSPRLSPGAGPGSPPMLPKIHTDLSSTKDESIPQLSLDEDTPRASAYEGRQRALHKAARTHTHDSHLGGRSMNTLREDASEDDDMDGRTPTHDRGGIAQAQASITPKNVVDAVTDAVEAASLDRSSCKPSPSKVVFRDPFQGSLAPSSKPAVRADIVDDDSPETQVTFTARGKPRLKTSSKRSSLSGFRSIFRGRSQTQ